MEDSMDIVNADVSKGERAEKEVVEGLCLSNDMIKGICLEPMQKCDAMQDDDE